MISSEKSKCYHIIYFFLKKYSYSILILAQRNRGKQSDDDKDFAPAWHPVFKEAADDTGYLLTRGYASNSALQIVGNRYKLNKRQYTAIMRVSASEQAINIRKQSMCKTEDLKGNVVDKMEWNGREHRSCFIGHGDLVTEQKVHGFKYLPNELKTNGKYTYFDNWRATICN